MEEGANSSAPGHLPETSSSSSSQGALSSAAPVVATASAVWSQQPPSRRCLLGLVVSAGLLLMGYVAVQPSVRPTIMYGVLSSKHGDLPSPPPLVLLTDKADFQPDKLEFIWRPQEPPQQQQDKEAVIVTRGEGVAACDLVVEGHDLLAFNEPAEAHACLRNKSIVLVGDSLTRYQYLNLVQFLENGQWWNPDPQLECEFQWGGSWPHFYNGTNARFNGREVCDCYREEPAGRQGNIENRFYYNEETDVWVSFFQWFNVECGHQGHDLAWLNVAVPPSRRRRAAKWQLRAGQERRPRRTQTGCAPGACNGPRHWSHDIYGLLEHVVPQLHPDVLVLNSGHWGRLPGAYDLDKLTLAAKMAVRSGGRVIYKTTTAPKGPAPFQPEDDLAAHFQKENISVLDAGTITFGARDVEAQLGETQGTHLYWDMLHFFSPVYAGLNKVLLNYMCPA